MNTRDSRDACVCRPGGGPRLEGRSLGQSRSDILLGEVGSLRCPVMTCHCNRMVTSALP